MEDVLVGEELTPLSGFLKFADWLTGPAAFLLPC